MSNSSSSIAQQVIAFIANYTNSIEVSLNSSTTLASLGIVSTQDTVELIMELEDSFGIPYEEGDAEGIVTVGDAIALIQSKLNG
jgi:acyl carrier protein